MGTWRKEGGIDSFEEKIEIRNQMFRFTAHRLYDIEIEADLERIVG